ncbi:MAG TPA: alpha-galactosidase [Myxococcota bacterium]|nr:alpha-galactosidase [Myxococcota bacterium]HRY92980.1 alpha-galactosidase [Myxococcota bacterium]HSA19911.1 alpha-galactosidase [Myxococcota bacterium]
MRWIHLVSGLAAGLLAAGCGDGRGGPGACQTDLDCSEQELCGSGVCNPAAGLRADLGEPGRTRLVVRLTRGAFDLYAPDGALVLRGARGHLALDGFARELSTADLGRPELERTTESDGLGPAEVLRLRYPASADGLEVSWELRAPEAVELAAGVVVRLGVRNAGAAPVTVWVLAPARARAGEGGGLYLGSEPAALRILENGSGVLADQVAQLVPGDKPADPLNAVVPFRLQGHSESNWSHLVFDGPAGRVWQAGALSVERGIPVLGLADVPPPAALPDGRQGLGLFSADVLYLPEGKPLAPGQELLSEPILLSASRASPDPAATAFTALEGYADAVHDHLGIRTWLERGGRVPDGWNSWSTSGSTGGYGTDEARIRANLGVVRDELSPWGMAWFQIDDGWQAAYGDWQPRADRFPGGFSAGAGILSEIRAAGLRPGLWMAPFTAREGSDLLAEHPGWFPPRSGWGGVLFADLHMLDPSHPEVAAFLEETGRRAREDWGVDWLKMDFAYPLMLCRGFHEPGLTAVEVYRRGLQALRAGLGDQTFLLHVGLLGVTYGLVDGMRTTMDNLPVWDGYPEKPGALERQGFKPTIANAARRYWLHGRVWVNHPDLLVFRSDTTRPDLPPITLEESRAFATFVAATGGIAKLGDRLLEDLAPYPERLAVVRALLPVHPQAARPLDLFTREVPEVYAKLVAGGEDGLAGPWLWVALLNLGANLDHASNPPGVLPDGETRAYPIDPQALGLPAGPWHAYEFWQQRYLGLQAEPFMVSVSSHDARALAVRPALDRPQFLGWDRQITLGGVGLGPEGWDAGTGELSLTLAAAPGPVSLAFHGNGHAFVGLTSPAGASAEVDEDGLVRVSAPAQPGPITLRLAFAP